MTRHKGHCRASHAFKTDGLLLMNVDPLQRPMLPLGLSLIRQVENYQTVAFGTCSLHWSERSYQGVT